MTTAEKDDIRTMTTSRKQELTGAEATRPGPVYTPAVDIFETESAITVLADMPGVRADGLTVDLHENRLTITGTVPDAEETEDQALVREYETGTFHREFRLSNAIDQGGINARLRDGVLRLTLPKAERARRRKIEIATG